MKHVRFLLFGGAALGAPGLFAAGGMLQDGQARGGPPSACEAVAKTQHQAALLDARVEFLETMALCINDFGYGLEPCRDFAEREYADARRLAEEQFAARLDACDLLGEGPYRPQLDPADFSATIDHPYFPQVPGRTLIYEKRTAEGLERVEVTALPSTREIDGVRCREVRDVVTLDGEFVEDTIDWFAQHRNGEVWYLGEISMNYEDGFLTDIDGSWRSGVEGAKPGIVMLAAPATGDAYRQEYFLGDAEDIARVESTVDIVTIGVGTFHDCVRTLDWSPLEPGNFENKYYAPDVGLILEVDLATGERLELIGIR